MQNIQTLICWPGVDIYICKYIGNIDEKNYTVVSTDARKSGTLVTETSFLHNIKVPVSNYNKTKAIEKGAKSPQRA